MDIALQVTGIEDPFSALWTGTCCVAMLLYFLVWVYICIWVYRDAEKRGSSGFLWAFLVFVFGLIPLIIWFIARPPLRQNQQYNQYGYMPPPPSSACPTCGTAMSYVPQYGMWYCYNCRKYPQQGPQVIITREIVKLPCSYCGMLNDSTQNQCSSCGARLLGK